MTITNSNIEKVEKKRLSPVLKSMEVGECQEYPIRRYVSVLNTIQRVQKVTKKKFRTTSTKTKILVYRIQ